MQTRPTGCFFQSSWWRCCWLVCLCLRGCGIPFLVSDLHGSIPRFPFPPITSQSPANHLLPSNHFLCVLFSQQLTPRPRSVYPSISSLVFFRPPTRHFQPKQHSTDISTAHLSHELCICSTFSTLRQNAANLTSPSMLMLCLLSLPPTPLTPFPSVLCVCLQYVWSDKN